MDGTFCQDAPLNRLAGLSGPCFSIDLKSATDRMPVYFLQEVVFGQYFSTIAMIHTLSMTLIDNRVIREEGCNNQIMFRVGQPLGFYASWASFALSHHFLIWYSAEQVYPGKKFTKYAILGDDVVIVDKSVRDVYMKILSSLGVVASPSKTLSSPDGVAEFAKKFRMDRLRLDVSPVSMKVISLTVSTLGWYAYMQSHATQYHLKYSTLMRIAGIGYKARSRNIMSKCHGKHARRLSVMILHTYILRKFDVYMSLSVCIGVWIEPEVIGRLYAMVLSHIAPKDPIFPPRYMFSNPSDEEFLHNSTYRDWMKQYLSYLKWYVLKSVSDTCKLDELLSPPLYNHKCENQFPQDDIVELKFGLTFKLYDWCEKLRRNKILLIDSGLSNVKNVENLSSV